MGNFVNSSLLSGEEIQAHAETSWLSQFWYFIFALLTVWTVFLPVVFLAIAIMNVLTTEVAVTNKKVIGKTGFIRRDTVDLPLGRVESMQVDQGVIGRLLGYGRLTIVGVGGSRVGLPYIKDPLTFRRVVMGLADTGRAVPTAPVIPAQ